MSTCSRDTPLGTAWLASVARIICWLFDTRLLVPWTGPRIEQVHQEYVRKAGHGASTPLFPSPQRPELTCRRFRAGWRPPSRGRRRARPAATPTATPPAVAARAAEGRGELVDVGRLTSRPARRRRGRGGRRIPEAQGLEAPRIPGRVFPSELIRANVANLVFLDLETVPDALQQLGESDTTRSAGGGLSRRPARWRRRGLQPGPEPPAPAPGVESDAQLRRLGGGRTVRLPCPPAVVFGRLAHGVNDGVSMVRRDAGVSHAQRRYLARPLRGHDRCGSHAAPDFGAIRPRAHAPDPRRLVTGLLLQLGREVLGHL